MTRFVRANDRWDRGVVFEQDETAVSKVLPGLRFAVGRLFSSVRPGR